MTSVLILCTGNSCRSQMAEGFLTQFLPEDEVHSAGTYPAARVNPNAVAVMKERGIDISEHVPKAVDTFLASDFDYVITVCDDAREACPAFSGRVRHRLHFGFEDPSFARGSDEQVLKEFRKTRGEIERTFRDFATSLRSVSPPPRTE